MEDQVRGKEIWKHNITEPNYGCHVVAVSCFSFFLVSKLVVFLTPLVAQTEKSSWKWKNISVSFIHSVLSSIWAFLCFYERPDMAEDLITIFTPLSHSLAAFSVGYFLYDLIELLVHQRTRQSLELIGHHVVIISCFMVAVLTRHYVGYAVVALIVEINSIFLHFRQLLQICGTSKFNPWYRLNSLINLATFIVCRILLLCWMTRWIVINKDAVPLLFYTMGSVGLAVMVGMNIILFYRLLRSDFISVKDTADSSSKKVD
ncbi:TLC domain-containing protein 2 [Aplysia californica]|uniref:TLC domain-containing protein 2 n=1 Tax=Aplysia californica TaxID=6500 RepID=A0ABM1A8I4_APLCA|nr:TLC domain-containing protein 2 [Aplysia californica]